MRFQCKKCHWVFEQSPHKKAKCPKCGETNKERKKKNIIITKKEISKEKDKLGFFGRPLRDNWTRPWMG